MEVEQAGRQWKSIWVSLKYIFFFITMENIFHYFVWFNYESEWGVILSLLLCDGIIFAKFYFGNVFTFTK